MIAIPIGLVAGIVAALKQNSIFDPISMIASLFAASMPNYWLGLILILIFAYYLRLVPVAGYGTPGQVILPALTLGLSIAGSIARLTRSSLLEVIRQDYIVSARARGLNERTVVIFHALRNAVIPIFTLIGLYFGYLMGGAYLVEVVFAWPGIGYLTYQAISNLDYPLVTGTILITTLLFVLVTLIVDIAYSYIDPRIQYA